MTTGQKIAALRRKRGMTQDALAEALSVTRQAVSKWEADAALPETGKLLPLARLLGCTADYLLGSADAETDAAQGHEPNGAPQSEPQEPAREKPAHDEPAQEKTAHDEPAQGRGPFIPYWGLPRRYVWAPDFEYKSERTLFGLPLVHINGKWGGTAKGVVAVGFKACGVVSVGFLSMGVLSAGVPGLQVGYFEGGAFVEGGAALQEACAQYVPAWLQWLAEAFCRLRLY